VIQLFQGRLAGLLAGVLAAACLLAGCGGADQVGISDLVPSPDVAWEDKGPAVLDGCRSGVSFTEAWTCVYGDPASPRTVVLWGDSHAMQFTTPMIELARRNGWRLVTMFRGSCFTGVVGFRPACDRWRANAMARIAEEKPGLIVTATDTGNGYTLTQGETRLSRKASEPLLREAWARTLRRLGEMTGNRPGGVVVIRDLPRSARRPPDCLEAHPDDLARCDFKGFRKNPPGFDLEAARQVDGVRLVDLSAVVCPGGICPAIRDGMVTYRDTTHLSATYAATLAGLLGQRIGSPP
jgi:hypothetical protein